MTGLDATHDPALRSWVPGADGHADFPIQNLPFGVFCAANGAGPRRGGVAIGGWIVDLAALCGVGAAGGRGAAGARKRRQPGRHAERAAWRLGRDRGTALRTARLFAAVGWKVSEHRSEAMLHGAARVGGVCAASARARSATTPIFTSGIHHANNGLARCSGPDNAAAAELQTRADRLSRSRVVHGASVRLEGAPPAMARPSQPDAGSTVLRPDRQRLDYELELGVWIGPGNTLGDTPIPDRRRGGTAHRRLLPAERLVGARRASLGVSAAGAVPVEELLQPRFRPGS